MEGQRYLEPDFDPNTLKEAQLRGILWNHDIWYPDAKKPELIQLFNQHIVPQAADLRRANANVKRSDFGIVDMATGHVGTGNDEDRPFSSVKLSSMERKKITSDADGKEERPIQTGTKPMSDQIEEWARSRGVVMPRQHTSQTSSSERPCHERPLNNSMNDTSGMLDADSHRRQHQRSDTSGSSSPQTPGSSINFNVRTPGRHLQQSGLRTPAPLSRMQSTATTSDKTPDYSKTFSTPSLHQPIQQSTPKRPTPAPTTSTPASQTRITELERTIQSQNQIIATLKANSIKTATENLAKAKTEQQVSQALIEQLKRVVETQNEIIEKNAKLSETFRARVEELERKEEDQEQVIVELEGDVERMANEINELHGRLRRQ